MRIRPLHLLRARPLRPRPCCACAWRVRLVSTSNAYTSVRLSSTASASTSTTCTPASPSPSRTTSTSPAAPGTTPTPVHPTSATSATTTAVPSPYHFASALSLFPKRPPRPFPPPFNSPPRQSFTDALTTEGAAWLRGTTNGDDAALAERFHLVVADGVGAWNTRSLGHAALWSRLLVHFFDEEVKGEGGRKEGVEGVWGRDGGSEEGVEREDGGGKEGQKVGEGEGEGGEEVGEAVGEDIIAALEKAYERTLSTAGKWQGTTTFVCAALRGPNLLLTNLGDSVAMVFRPTTTSSTSDSTTPTTPTSTSTTSTTTTTAPTSTPPAKPARRWILAATKTEATPDEAQEQVQLLARTAEQWHWFDCPRQLGTNSPDRPRKNAIVTAVPVREGDVVVVASDGLVDNLWEWEIRAIVGAALDAGGETVETQEQGGGKGESAEGAKDVGEEGKGEEGKKEEQEKGEEAKKEVRERDQEKADEKLMHVLATALVDAAKKVAMDPFAESPYMERSVEEGLGIEGGKWDDVSVVAAVVRRNHPTTTTTT